MTFEQAELLSLPRLLADAFQANIVQDKWERRSATTNPATLSFDLPVSAGNTVIISCTNETSDRYVLPEDPQFQETQRGEHNGLYSAQIWYWVNHPGGQQDFLVNTYRMTTDAPQGGRFHYRLEEVAGVTQFHSDDSISDNQTANRSYGTVGVSPTGVCYVGGVNYSDAWYGGDTPNPEFIYRNVSSRTRFHSQVFENGRTSEVIPFTQTNPTAECASLLALTAGDVPPPVEEPKLFVGIDAVDDLKVGSEQVSKLIAGSTQVWPAPTN